MNKDWKYVIAFAALSASSTALSAQNARRDIISKSGNAFLGQCGPDGGTIKLECYVYLTGFVAGLSTSQMATGERIICIPEEAQIGQLNDVVIADLQRDPTTRHRPTSTLTYVALLRAYPCKQPKR